ncbi:D-alanyl-D-alanine-carboxypeptidase/endopeptidase AmpH precursor [Planctomycetes bacterium MalM25]|nr:D-alanyl-D-alanine-carboxypeptidase/endopeptidase AmpH precursor [Planctomycetes bacterium MalM25]
MKRLSSFAVASTLVASMSVAAGLPRLDPAGLGMRGDHLRHIEREVEAAHGEGQFAGCVVAIGRREGLAMLWAYGDRQVEPAQREMTIDTVFDLASLTKPIATATSVMVLLEEGLLRLRDPISKHLPEITNEHADQITIERLLTHHTGYVPDNALEDYRHGVEEAWRRLFALEPQDPPGTRFRYSDVNFELLGKLVERISDQPLNEFAGERVFAPIGMHETTYLPPADLQARSAASEPREGRMLVGEVHDPRAALLGGVAGHAGLFSTAADLSRYAAMMLGEGQLDGVRVLSPATVREMTRPREVSGHRRGGGWDMRSGYSSNRGELMTDRAFGHGGFTGTAIWIDPGLDLFVIFLSNRLHPDGHGSVNDLAGRIATIAAASIEQP